MNQIQANNFHSMEVAYLTPPQPKEVDGKKEERKCMVEDALYNLNECISALYSLDESNLALDLEDFRESIKDLKEVY